MDEPHAFTGLFAGDYFIHRFDFDGAVTFAYGLVRSIDAEGHYACDYMAQTPPSQPATVGKEDHRVLGRITKRGYALARMRGWPNDEPGVAAIIDFAAGKRVPLLFIERLLLFFTR